MLRRNARQAALAVLFAVVVSGCGGGGGGAGSDTRTTSGLVPAAPALGATLYADATVLRPLVAAGVWEYHGTLTRSGGEAYPAVYTNTITQQNDAGGAMTESASDVDHAGAAQQSVFIRNGEVHAVTTLDLGTGQTQTVDQLELRSPVRVGDQYTVLDSHATDSGLDIDGDGRGEALDIAIYTRVVGEEFVDLVSYPNVKAVRLTTTVSARFTLSKTNSDTETATGTQDVWYAPGIGIIKRRSDVPGPDIQGRPPGTTREVTTEALVNWDGVTQGIGFLQPKPAKNVVGDQLQYLVDAVGFDTHALVMTYFDSSVIHLTQIDGRGEPTANNAYALDTSAQLVRVGDVARVITNTAAGIQMYSFDAAGNSTAPGAVVLKAGEFAAWPALRGVLAVGSGDAFWVTWIQPPPIGGIGYKLQAQSFNAAGQPLAPPLLLTNLSSDTVVDNLRADGAPGHVIVVWDESQPAGFVKRYALIDGSGALSVHTLVPANGVLFSAHPAATTAGATVFWTWFSGVGNTAGVSFDAAGEPLRSNALSIERETLSSPWLESTANVLATGGATAIAVGQSANVKLWPEDTIAGYFTIVTELTPDDQPLALSSRTRLLARGVPIPAPHAAVRLTNNVLLFSEDGYGLNVTSVWRRP